MPSECEISPALAASLRRTTTSEYHLMIKHGIIMEGDPYELLDGLIVHKDRSSLGTNPRSYDPVHAFVVGRLAGLSARCEGHNCFLCTQLPITLGEFNEPEPDGAFIRGCSDDYREKLPGSSDVLCVIEIAHASLERDRGAKLGIYAAAGIPQYFIVNLRVACVEIYTDPHGRTYCSKRIVSGGDKISIYLGAERFITIRVSDLIN